MAHKKLNKPEPRKDSMDNPYSKTRYDLVPWWASDEEAKVFTYGAERYGDHNWKSFSRQQMMHYYGAILRHLAKIRSGEIIDPESNLHHTGHIRANSTFLEYFQRNYGWF